MTTAQVAKKIHIAAIAGAFFISAFLGVSPATGSESDSTGLPPAPENSAKAWLVYDGFSGRIIDGDNFQEPLPIASFTKLMTALVVTKRTTGDEKVLISENAVAAGAGTGSVIGVTAGQEYPVDVLLNAMLVYSANDAAVALAEHVSGKEESFVSLMNEEAEKLDLSTAKFVNATGLDDSSNAESSAEEIVALVRVALKEPRISRAVKMKQVTVTRPGTTSITLENRNPLIGTYAGVNGIKTGHTDSAGYNLLLQYQDSDDRHYIVLLMGEPTEDAREDDGRALLDWARLRRQVVTISEAGEPIGSIPIADEAGSAELFVADEISATVEVGETLKERLIVPAELAPPITAGEDIGKYQLLAGNKVVATSTIYVDQDLKVKDWKQLWKRRLKGFANDWPGFFKTGWRTVTNDLERLVEGSN